ncbi:hypothetical protein ACWT_3773 [Actinoplanes sp. SE50]|uniref:hypothetical protein n=1 Tax=unclassified Actinoplanes TaxID=2626549 RepID=UPI00023ECB33|nr:MULTISPECIES: hypothetical protein [unclassified Actinoplanes]AEV84796.1 hypothetical protein ACPL_3901 [Actinoplanes sp. SE50/110]ATO83188.1 hypothetical protein ACWT_3773 [Actinoplanes sp. SE50]SLM00595.1 hypothetical protein ACSP50_3828 [Actinoplanes sp. SE50/110]
MKRVLIMTAGVLLLAGCGAAGGREDAAAAVASGLLTAVAGRDGAAACASLAPRTRAELEKSAGTSCPEAILDEHLPAPGRVISAAVFGQQAQVRLADDTIFLGVFPGGWRVLAAGCKPRGDQPYDCTLQGS